MGDGHREQLLRPAFLVQLGEPLVFAREQTAESLIRAAASVQVPSHAVELAGAYFVRHHKAIPERMARQVPRLHASCFPRSSFQELGGRGSQEDTTTLDSP